MEPFEIQTVPGVKALEEWQRHRSQFETTGLYPILLGNDDSLARLREAEAEEGYSRSEVLAQAAGVDAEAWVLDNLRKAQEYEFDSSAMNAVSVPRVPLQSPSIITDSYGRPVRTLHLGLVPVSAPWEVFAAMAWGGWNACPYPHEHVALHKSWNQRFGAEPVAVTDCEVECRVMRPPSDISACNQLATEQVLYCGDLNSQIHSSTEEVAQVLWKNARWYFWWD